MKMSPISVFGYLGFLCSADPDEATIVPLHNDGTYGLGIYYFFDGECIPTVVETNEVLPTRSAGWLNTEHESPAAGSGSLLTKFPSGAKWYCIPSAKNTELPRLQSINLGIAQSIDLAPGDRVFLVSGSVDVGGQILSASKALNISVPVTMYASTPVFALKFL